LGVPEPWAKALQVAELILSPLGDRDVVNSEVGSVEEVGKSFPEP